MELKYSKACISHPMVIIIVKKKRLAVDSDDESISFLVGYVAVKILEYIKHILVMN
jgi:hypothetical protein